MVTTITLEDVERLAAIRGLDVSSYKSCVYELVCKQVLNIYDNVASRKIIIITWINKFVISFICFTVTSYKTIFY